MLLTEDLRVRIEWALFGGMGVRPYTVEPSESVEGGIYAVVNDDPEMYATICIIDNELRVL